MVRAVCRASVRQRALRRYGLAHRNLLDRVAPTVVRAMRGTAWTSGRSRCGCAYKVRVTLAYAARELRSTLRRIMRGATLTRLVGFRLRLISWPPIFSPPFRPTSWRQSLQALAKQTSPARPMQRQKMFRGFLLVGQLQRRRARCVPSWRQTAPAARGDASIQAHAHFRAHTLQLQLAFSLDRPAMA